jgi:hypothetical protein
MHSFWPAVRIRQRKMRKKRVMYLIIVDVVSLNICDEDRKKHDYVRSISRSNTARFRLVQTFLKNNSPTCNIVVLCYRKIGCLE